MHGRLWESLRNYLFQIDRWNVLGTKITKSPTATVMSGGDELHDGQDNAGCKKTTFGVGASKAAG